MSGNFADILGPTPDCIPIEQAVKVFDQPADAAERRNRELHIASCAYCAAQLALLRQFENAEPTSEERGDIDTIVTHLQKNSPAAPEPWWSKLLNLRIMGASAVAVAAASILLLLNPRRRVEPPETPGIVMRSSQITGLAPVGELDSVPSQLRWAPVAGAGSYDVRLIEVDRTELWRAKVSTPSAELPAEIRARITPLKKLLWEVNALDPSGKHFASSGMQAFVRKE